MSRTPLKYAIAVAVGPGEKEVARLVDLAASASAYEHGPAHFVMLDDAPEPRHLDRIVKMSPRWTPISLPHPRHDRAQTFKVGKGIITAVLASLKWIQANTDAAFVLKLDTDSLIIAPFAEKLATLFATNPTLGMVGAHKTTPNGTARDWSHHAKTLRRLFEQPAFDWKKPLTTMAARRAWNAPATIDVYERAKRKTNFDAGEHCMGGGYAVSRTLLDRMAAAGDLDDVMRWSGIDLPEDVTVGMHVRGLDMSFADNVAAGELFGVRYRGLPFPPEELAAKAYAVIHAVKNDDAFDEATVRKFFAERRPSP